MRTHFRRVPFIAAVASLSISGSNLQAQERFTLTGREITIHNLAGTVQVVQGSGSATEVEVRRTGRDAAQLRIVPGTSGNASTLRVLYPGDEIVHPGMRGNSQTTVTVADDGTFGPSRRGGREVRIYSPSRAPRGAAEAAADILVRVPAGVRLETHVAVGETEARGVNASLDLHTYSGGISATNLKGEIALASASGNIEARDIEGSLAVRTASGTADVENVRGGAISVNVASGGIDANQLRGPSVDLKTASGRIRASDITADRLMLNSASGGVTARNVSAGEANVRTASGSIDVDLVAPIRSAELRAVSGNVNLRVPAGMGATLELKTASGGIRVSAPMTISSQRRGYTAGTIGDGAARVTATTTSGSVSITSR